MNPEVSERWSGVWGGVGWLGEEGELVGEGEEEGG